eukprot:100121-Chlamydomonas_euryale.AAC.6
MKDCQAAVRGVTKVWGQEVWKVHGVSNAWGREVWEVRGVTVVWNWEVWEVRASHRCGARRYGRCVASQKGAEREHEWHEHARRRKG